MGLSGVSSVVRSKYKNVVGEYDISYDVSQKYGANADAVIATIKKDDTRVGYINLDTLGRKSIVIENGVTDDDAILLVSTIITDSKTIFSELNNR